MSKSHTLPPNSLNIFHNNFNGLENKIDDLHQFLLQLNFRFDLLTITETSEKNSYGNFINNVNIEGYALFSTPSLSNKGGTAIYVKEHFDAFERTDLKAFNNLFETTWIEIKNRKSKNIVCGTIY